MNNKEKEKVLDKKIDQVYERNKKRTTIYSILLVLSFFIVVIGVTYAYFTIMVDERNVSTNRVEGGILDISIAGTPLEVNPAPIIYDIDKETKASIYNFTINSNGSVGGCYTMYINIDGISDGLTNNSNFRWELTNVTKGTTTNGSFVGKESGERIKIEVNQHINTSATYTYKLKLWMRYQNIIDQSDMLNTAFVGYITTEATSGLCYVPDAILKQQSNSGEFWAYKSSITKIIFENEINVPDGVISWDMSPDESDKVMAYIIDDNLGTSTYELHIQANGKIYANSNSGSLFAGFSNVTSIEGMEYFDTSLATKMNNMFQGMNLLTSLDLSNFNTSNVDDMSGMFNNMNSIISLDLSNFDTSKVTNMLSMFNNMSSIASLNLSSFDTSNVINMEAMFHTKPNLTSLDLSNFDTSSVANMDNMFINCTAITDLNLSNFDTSNVESMQYMFGSMTSLNNLNINSFTFDALTSYDNIFNSIKNNPTITVNSSSASFISARLIDASKTANIIIKDY